MNSIELEVEMKRHFDTGQDLASYLGITPQTFSNKKKGEGAEFTQTEIAKIAIRYNLTAERLVEIFFADQVSKLDTERNIMDAEVVIHGTLPKKTIKDSSSVMVESKNGKVVKEDGK